MARSAPSPRAQPSGDETGHDPAVADAVRTFADQQSVAKSSTEGPRPPDIPRDKTKSKFSLFSKISSRNLMSVNHDAKKEKEQPKEKEREPEKDVDKRKQQERKDKKEKKERDKKEKQDKKDKKDKERAEKKGKGRDEHKEPSQHKSKRTGIVGILTSKKPDKKDALGSATPVIVPSTPAPVPPISPVTPPSLPEQQPSHRSSKSARHSHRGGNSGDTITRSPRIVAPTTTSPRASLQPKSPREREQLNASARMRRQPEPEGHVRINDGAPRSASGKRRDPNLRRSGISERDKDKHDSQIKLIKLLQAKGLGQYAFVFEERRISYEQLVRMDANDLRELPLPPVARKRLHDEILHINGQPPEREASPRSSSQVRRPGTSPRDENGAQMRPKSTGLLERMDSISVNSVAAEQSGTLSRVENYKEQIAKLEASVAQWKDKYQTAAEANHKLDQFMRDHFSAYIAFLKQQENEYNRAVAANAGSAPSMPSHALTLSTSTSVPASVLASPPPTSPPPVAPRVIISGSSSGPMPPTTHREHVGGGSSSVIIAGGSIVNSSATSSTTAAAAPASETTASPMSPVHRDVATASSQPLGAVSSNERLASALMQFRLNSASNLLAGAEKIQRPRARCLYDYVADNQKELSFKAGDVLTILNQDQSGWWLAFLHGKSGFVPRNYLHVLPTP